MSTPITGFRHFFQSIGELSGLTKLGITSLSLGVAQWTAVTFHGFNLVAHLLAPLASLFEPVTNGLSGMFTSFPSGVNIGFPKFDWSIIEKWPTIKFLP